MATWTGTVLDVLVTIVAGYLVGSVPVANVVARRRGVGDLRETGDRNPGYWNAKEVLGRRAAVPVMIGDVAKGATAAAIGLLLADPGVWGVAYAGIGAAMVGHAFPVFAGFRGGRSVLTFVGGVIVVSPVAAALAIGLLLAVWVVARSFAAAARAGMVAFPIVQLVVEGPFRTAATGALMTFIGFRFATAARSARGPRTPQNPPGTLR